MLGPASFGKKLGNSFVGFINLIRFIRVNYAMDELWDGNETVKFRKSGKTPVSLCVKDNCFSVLVIFGKIERAVFDENRAHFCDYICDYYDNSNTYHYGKWMFIDVYTTAQSQEIEELLKIKKKPNRKNSIKQAEFGKCGQRCDICLLNEKNNLTGEGSIELNEKDWICHHSADEERFDYSKITCCSCLKGTSPCANKKCILAKGFEHCSQCPDYSLCRINAHGYDPADCNLGLFAEDITRAVMLYYSRFWLDKINDKI